MEVNVTEHDGPETPDTDQELLPYDPNKYAARDCVMISETDSFLGVVTDASVQALNAVNESTVACATAAASTRSHVPSSRKPLAPVLPWQPPAIWVPLKVTRRLRSAGSVVG